MVIMIIDRRYVAIASITIFFFVIINVTGAAIGGFKYEGNLDNLSADNPIANATTNFWFKESLDIVSKSNKNISRLHYMIFFDTPEQDESMNISLAAHIQPVFYDYLIFNQSLYDYIEAEITELSVGSGNETLIYNIETGSLKKLSLSTKETIVSIEINLPSNWHNSENKTLTFVWGNFKVVSNEKRYEGKTIEGYSEIRIMFTKSDFKRGYEKNINGLRWVFQTNFSIQLSAKGPVRVMLVFLIIFIVLLAISVFTYDIANATTDMTKDEYSTFQETSDIRRNIDKENYNCFVKFSRYRGIFFSTSTILFIFSVLLYFMAYVIFGAPAVKSYPFPCVILALISYCAFLVIFGIQKYKKYSILKDLNDKETIRKILNDIENRYKTVIKEIIAIIATLITLYLFVFGGKAFQYLWF